MTSEQENKLDELAKLDGYRGVRKERALMVTMEFGDFLILEDGTEIQVEDKTITERVRNR